MLTSSSSFRSMSVGLIWRSTSKGTGTRFSLACSTPRKKPLFCSAKTPRLKIGDYRGFACAQRPRLIFCGFRRGFSLFEQPAQCSALCACNQPRGLDTAKPFVTRLKPFVQFRPCHHHGRQQCLNCLADHGAGHADARALGAGTITVKLLTHGVEPGFMRFRPLPCRLGVEPIRSTHHTTLRFGAGRGMSRGHSRSAGQFASNQARTRAAVAVRQSPPSISFLKKSPLPRARIEIAKWVTP